MVLKERGEKALALCGGREGGEGGAGLCLLSLRGAIEVGGEGVRIAAAEEEEEGRGSLVDLNKAAVLCRDLSLHPAPSRDNVLPLPGSPSKYWGSCGIKNLRMNSLLTCCTAVKLRTITVGIYVS